MDFSCKAKGLVKYLKLSTQFSGFNPDCSATCCIIPLESSYFVFWKPVCPPLMNQFLPLSCVLFHWLLRAFLWEETTILPPFKHFWQPKSSAQGGTESPLLAGWRFITLPREHNVWSAESHCLCQTGAKKANTENCSSGGWEGRWVSHQPNSSMAQCFCSDLQKYKPQENIKKKHH